MSLLIDGADAAAAVSRQRHPGSLTHTLWMGSADIFAKIIEHPFIVGLVDGSLERACFVQFLQQDSHYLRAFARSLNLLAVKSPRPEWARLFAGHAVEAVAGEEALQDQLLEALGSAAADPARPASPTTFAYMAHLLASCYDGSFLQGLATVLPCYWIYAEVGTVLQAAGSADSLYASWIDSYAGDEYGAVVSGVLDIVDDLGADAGSADVQRCGQLYRVGSRLEWMFWDAAHRREGWPV